MAEPSTDTFTFLFTDIEGSTKLWEHNASKMQAALARHDEILKSTVEEHGGHVFKMVGDACYAAFTDASRALEAALAAQRALFAEPWDEECKIRVRMALHTGAAEERDDDYFGAPLNRVSCLLSAGHGGQTLLSGATRSLIADQLLEGASLRDLGERRLKDLVHPERVFQLLAPDLPTSFPPLKTLEARLNNLPAQPTVLIGREREVAEVCEVLRREDVRLLTLTGPGGTGKTWLALRVAADLIDEYESGVSFVALANTSDPALVVSAIAQPLRVTQSEEQPLMQRLKDCLRDKKLLLVLDGFEQVLEAAPLVTELLADCPQVKVLATSRVALRLYGEHEYLVSSLKLPDLERQQTMREAINRSYELLDEDEQALFRRLAIFAGGFRLEAAEAVCDAEGDLGADVLDGVESLLDKGLLRQQEEESVQGEARFVMLETLREYALERLEESGEAETIKHRHFDYHCALVQEVESEPIQLQPVEGLRRLEAEHDNLRAALSWSQKQGDTETVTQIDRALRRLESKQDDPSTARRRSRP